MQIPNVIAYAQERHKNLPVYQPGKPIDSVAREFGLDVAQIAKLASNENPLGSSPKAKQAVCEALENVHLYPDGSSWHLKHALASSLQLSPSQVVMGNGSNDIIAQFAHAFIGPGDEAVMGQYAFPVYQIVTLLMGGKPILVDMPSYKHDLDLLLNAITPKTRAVFLPSPNNPTGTVNSKAEILEFVAQLPEHVAFLYDEAYVEYLDDAPDLRPFIAEGRPILACRTFSKIYGLAGLRVGYGYGSEPIIELMNAVREPFNVNSLAQAAALAALEDSAFVKESKAANRRALVQLEAGFAELGLDYIPSAANFVMVQVPKPLELFEQLQREGMIVRPIPSKEGHLRVSCGTEAQNERLLAVLSSLIKENS